MKETKVYTDGACSGNPGSGGWGVVESLTKFINILVVKKILLIIAWN